MCLETAGSGERMNKSFLNGKSGSSSSRLHKEPEACLTSSSEFLALTLAKAVVSPAGSLRLSVLIPEHLYVEQLTSSYIFLTFWPSFSL